MLEAPAPSLAIIIPHYNDTARLARCLEELADQFAPEVEVVVADNATPGGIADVAARFNWVLFVTQPQPGAGLARNAGVAASTAPWIAFLDADCVPNADWVAAALWIAEGDADTITGGRIDVFDESSPPRSGAEAFETVFAFKQERYIRKRGFSVTANLVTSRATFERAGLFRDDVSEDVEWSRRAVASGARLTYANDLIVSHPTRAGWEALSRKWRRLTTEEYALAGQYGRAGLPWVVKALAMPASALVHIPKVLCAGTLSGLERRRALGTLLRLRAARMVWMLRLWRGREL